MSSVSAPHAGAARTRRLGVRLKRNAWPIIVVWPNVGDSTVCAMPRCCTCGSLNVSSRCPFRKSCASTFWRRQRIELGHCRIMFDHFSLVIRSSTMPVPLAPPVTLGCEEQAHLASIVRAHSTPQALVLRCRLILRTAAPDRPSNLQVAQELHCNRHTVGRWRSRYLAQGRSGLQDAPRPGRPRRFSPLSASGCAFVGHPETHNVPLPRHALELGRPGDRPPAASHRDHESLEYLAHAGRGGPQTSSQRLLAQQPRPRL